MFFEAEWETSVYQWKYTACRYNIEGSNGFYTFSTSTEISREEKEELVETVAHYVQLDSAPSRPTPDDLSDPTKFPVAFVSFKLTSGKSVICRVRAVGRDYGGTRYGNFFAHALILSEGAWRDPIRYFASPTFADGLTNEEANLGKTPKPLPSLKLDDVEAAPKPKPFSTDSNALSALVDGFVEALRSRKNLVVGASPENLKNAAKFLGDFLAVLPPEIAAKIEFTTYSNDPASEELFKRSKYVFLAFAPLERVYDVPEDKRVVVDLDAALRGKRASVSAYAKVLSTQFLEFSKDFVYAEICAPSKSDGVPNGETQDERTLDLRYLNELAIVYSMTRGVFPQIESGWESAWSFLSADKRTVLRERWIATQRFLNRLPFHVGLAVAQNLLQCDLSRFAKPGLKLQENVKGSELAGGENAPNRFVSMLTRNILSYVVVFCAKNRFENPEATDETMRRFVAFWVRSIPTGARENKLWRGDALRYEIPEIFGADSPARVAAFDSDDRIVGWVLNFFLDLPNPSDYEVWIAIALGIQIAIETPQALGSRKRERLRELFKRCLATPSARAEFERIYLKLFVEKVKTQTTYSLIFDLMGVGGDKLKEYAEGRLIGDWSLAAWKRGESLRCLNASIYDESDGVFANSESSDLVFMDDRALLAERFSSKKKSEEPTVIFSGKSGKHDARNDAEPGSIAFVAYLVDWDKLAALERVFGGFRAGELKRAVRFFGERGIDLTKYASFYPALPWWNPKRWPVWTRWTFGVLGAFLILTALGVGVWKALCWEADPETSARTSPPSHWERDARR